MWQDSASCLTRYLHTLGHKDLPFLEDFISPWVFVSHGFLCCPPISCSFLRGFPVFCIHLSSSFIPLWAHHLQLLQLLQSAHNTDFCLKVVSSILDTDVHWRLEVHKLPKPQTRPTVHLILISIPFLCCLSQ